jgi:hypothetical protein
MLFLMLAAVLFALLVGALAFVTGPVGLGMAALIATWLVLYAARSLLRSRRSGHASRSAGRAESRSAPRSAGQSAVRSGEVVHRV